LTNLRTQQENRLDSLLIKNFISNANKTRADIEKSTDEISRINDEINGLLEANNVLFDSISEYQVKINNVVNNSEVASELGPLIFLSETTGLPIQSVVNYLIIIIMLVFDPLAVILLISANKLDEIDKIDIDKRQYTTTEPIMTNNTFDVNTNETSVPDETIDKFDVISGETENTVVQEVNPDEKTENSLSETINNTIKRIIPENNPFNKRQPVIPRGKMTRDDIPLVKEAVNRGFTVRVPNPKTR
jgi:hypothetical protein